MSTSATKDPPAGADGGVAAANHARRWWILAVLGIAQLMVILDSTIVNIALPSAQRSLHFSNADRQWVVTAYSLAFGSLLLLGGRIGDMVGRKLTLVIGLVGFAGASAVGGFSVDFPMLVGARAVQGIFGALLAPSVLALLTTTFKDPAERGKAFGIYGAIAGAGGALGLLLGGALTSYASWRWTLFINLVFAALAATGAMAWLRNEKGDSHDPLDIPGLVTVTAGLFLVVYGFSHAETTSWSNPLTIACLAASVVLLTAFAIIEARVSHPLLPLRIVLDRTRGGSMLAMLFAAAGMFGIFLFLTYYLQGTLGFSPVKTGIAFLPMVGALVVVAQLSNRVLLRMLGPKLIVPPGLVLAAVALFFLHDVGVHTSYWTHVLPELLALGVGFGLSLAPSFNVGTLGLTPDDAGVGSATLNTAQQVGGSIGTALLNTIAASAASAYLVGRVVSPATSRAAAVHSYTTAFLWSAGIFTAAAVLAAVVLKRGTLQQLTAGVDVSGSNREPDHRPLVPPVAAKVGES
jgi:EmrB/QacA subfamily drug resistance transporter